MGQAHDHGHGGDAQSYFVEQLCTIGICGALGGVAITMYVQSLGKDQTQSMLGLVLKPSFHWMVMAAGVVLVLCAAVRAVALWFEVGSKTAAHGDACCHDHEHAHAHDHAHNHEHEHGPDCHHDHEHGPDCDHEHAHDHDHVHDHEHDHVHEHEHNHGGGGHDHEHGVSTWRYVLLLLPITLFLLNLPNKAFSYDHMIKNMSGADLRDINIDDAIKNKGDDVIALGFKELDDAAWVPDRRADLQGQRGMLRGVFVPGKIPNTCRLVRWKMTCCAPDAIPLDVWIISPTPLANMKPGQWVEVTGQVQFRAVGDRGDYKAVLQLASPKDVVPIPPDPNPYLL